MNEIILYLSNLLNENMVIAPIVAMVIATIAAFNPCNLSQLPILFNNYRSKENLKLNKKSILFYCLGNIVFFVVLGIAFILFGNIISNVSKIGYIIIGIILSINTLYLVGVFERNTCKIIKVKEDLFSNFLNGIFGGIVASPCTVPIILTILFAVSITNNIILIILVILGYVIGHSSVILLFSKLGEIIYKNDKTIILVNKIFKIVLAICSFLLALHMFYLGF